MPTDFKGFKQGGNTIPVNDTTARNGVIANTKLIKDTVGWSGKNLLKNILTSVTTNNITFTVNTDGSITVSTTNEGATADTTKVVKPFVDNGNIVDNSINGKKLILSGCPNGGSETTYRLLFFRYNGSNSAVDYGDGTSAVDVNLVASGYTNVAINIKQGTVISTPITFKPMLRDASILDDTYEPYHSNVVNTLREAEVIQGKNLIPYPYVRTGALRGVTVTENKDGSIKLNGTVAGGNFLYNLTADTLGTNEKLSTLRGKYILSVGNVTMPDNAVLSMKKSEGDVLWSVGGSQHEITVDLTEALHTTGWIYLYAPTGTVFNNLTVYPMLRLATETDSTYEPYYIPLKDSMFPRSEQAVLGAYNILPKNPGTKTIQGVTFTEGNNDVITLSGTATDYVSYQYSVRTNKDFKIPKGRWKVIPRKVGTDGSYIIIGSGNTGDGTTGTFETWASTQNDPVILTIDDVKSNRYVTFSISADNGSIMGSTYQPMIVPADTPDDLPYAPHAMTNKELTEKVKHTRTIRLENASSCTFSFPEASANNNEHPLFLALMSSTGSADVNVLAGYKITNAVGNIKTIAGAATGSFDTSTGKFTITADGPQRTLTIIANAEITV